MADFRSNEQHEAMEIRESRSWVIQAARQFSQRAQQFLFRYNWWILLALTATTLFSETYEHLASSDSKRLFFYIEMITISLLLVIAGVLIRQMTANLTERSRLINLLNHRNQLGIQLSSAVDNEDLNHLIVSFVSKIVPTASIALYQYREDEKNYDLITSQPAADCGPIAITARVYGASPCLSCSLRREHAKNKLSLCSRSGGTQYCMPFLSNKRAIGLITITLPESESISSGQAELLEAANQDITSALISTREKKLQADFALAQATRELQFDIARDLHDTIGQNIGYLRMKVEYLLDSDSTLSPETRREIEQMNSVADESYDLVRGTLALLQSGSTGNLETLFSSHARMIADRSGMAIAINSQGEQAVLPPKTYWQLFYIFREALSNIEKHAQASQVSIDICWELQRLTLTISDNGIGFTPEQNNEANHYGLIFMKSRTENLKGILDIRTAPGEGTRIILHLPIGEPNSPLSRQPAPLAPEQLLN